MKKANIIGFSLLCSLLNACVGNLNATDLSQAKKIYIADLGRGQGQVQVQIIPEAKAFQIQDSESGAPRALIANIQSFRVFLVDGSSGEPSGFLTPAPNNGDVFTIPRSGGTRQTVFFDHVPPGQYYACMAAFNDLSTFTSSTNISEPTITTYAEGPVYCSNDGGEADFPGRVEVYANYHVSDTSRLLILPLQLVNEKPAMLDTEITIQDGDGN